MKNLLVAGALISAACSCKRNIPDVKLPFTDSLEIFTTPDFVLGNYDLVWHDEFNGNSLDLTKWNYRAEGTTRGFGLVSRDNVELNGNGQLLIKVTKSTDGTYQIGQIGTQDLFETTYGYFECRAKMNKSIGPHVAFWLQSPTYGGTANPASDGAEIDIFEYHRRKADSVYNTVHWNGYGADHESDQSASRHPALKEGFHTFALEWSNSRYIFYVDGVETWRTNSGLSKRSQYIILSAELNGWGGDPATGVFPDAVEFDYVRVFKKKN